MQIKTILHKTPNFCAPLENEGDYQHVDAHTQQVIGYLDKRTCGYGGVNMNLLKKKRQQRAP